MTDTPEIVARYPGIAKAALLISHDNGGTHRGRSAARRLGDLARFLSNTELSLDMRAIDDWLNGLSKDDLEEVCCGCQDDDPRKALMDQAPPFTDQLLEDFYHEAA